MYKFSMPMTIVPYFDEESYSGSVREDAEVGVVVLQVHATDSDEGSSGSVMYSLVTDGGLPQNLPFSVGGGKRRNCCQRSIRF